MVLENFVRITSTEGDTQCVYELEDPTNYNKAKKEIMDYLLRSRLLVGWKDGKRECLANNYAHMELVTDVAKSVDDLDMILKDESITGKTILAGLGGG